jgi:hypothetical protein
VQSAGDGTIVEKAEHALLSRTSGEQFNLYFWINIDNNAP